LENGSGKSTLIEAIAIKWGFNPEGGSRAPHPNVPG
jgi:predicted ATPase